MDKVTSLKKQSEAVQTIGTSYRTFTASFIDRLKGIKGGHHVRQILPKDNLVARAFIQKTLMSRGGVGMDKLYYDAELSDIYEAYSGEDRNFFVITLGNEIIGTLGIAVSKKSYEDVCEFKKVYALDNKKDLLMRLVQKGLHWARKCRYTYCLAEVEYRNVELQDALSAHGFEPVERTVSAITYGISLH